MYGIDMTAGRGVSQIQHRVPEVYAQSMAQSLQFSLLFPLAVIIIKTYTTIWIISYLCTDHLIDYNNLFFSWNRNFIYKWILFERTTSYKLIMFIIY